MFFVILVITNIKFVALSSGTPKEFLLEGNKIWQK